MEFCLYDKTHGYYASTNRQFGRHGDFITACNIGDGLGLCILNQIKELQKENSLPLNILEFGAGNGDLAKTLIENIDKVKKEESEDIREQYRYKKIKYYIVEKSEQLKKLQRNKLYQIQQNTVEVEFVDQIPKDFDGYILANEVLDAFSVRKFIYHNNNFLEVGVNIKEEPTYTNLKPTRDLHTFLEKYKIRGYMQKGPYISEVNTGIAGFVQHIKERANRFTAILIDYGFLRDEYYHPDRKQGTLIGHKEHKVVHDLLQEPTKVDLTAHVDFEAVMQEVEENNLTPIEYTNFANFLINNNILEMNIPPSEISMLCNPHEMGELFKVMVFGDQIEG